MSDGIEQITGYPASQFIGNEARTYASVIHPADRGPVEDEVEACVARREPFILEYRVLTAEGEVRWVHEQGRAVCGADGEVLYLDGSIFDIGERKRLEAQLEHLAYHDALTGLPNRRRLMEGLGALDGRHLLVFFDLDGFKAYNDSFGHLEGDLLLRRLSRKLREAVERRGVAFRLGGDEFCILGADAREGRPLPDCGVTARRSARRARASRLRHPGEASSLPEEAHDATAHWCWPTSACTPTRASGAYPRSSRRATSSCASWPKGGPTCTSTRGPPPIWRGRSVSGSGSVRTTSRTWSAPPSCTTSGRSRSPMRF